MNATKQNYLEHEFFVAMQRNMDDPITGFLDPEIFPSHQIDAYMPDVKRIAYGYFRRQGRHDLIKKYGLYGNEREEAIA